MQDPSGHSEMDLEMNDNDVKAESDGRDDAVNSEVEAESYGREDVVNSIEVEAESIERAVTDESTGSHASETPVPMCDAQSNRRSGPESEKLKGILERTGYPHKVTPQQHVYGPPPGREDEKLPSGVQCHIGKLSYHVFEDTLIELFEKCGPIYELRLMINQENGLNKGFAFVTYFDKESAKNAVETYNNYDINGKRVTVTIASPNNTLFIGSIPKNRSREEIHSAFSQEVDGIVDVIAQPPLKQAGQDDIKNRGFCFLNFEDYKSAAAARQILRSGKCSITEWRNYRNFTCDWADPVEEIPDEVMAQVKTLFVKNISETTTEEVLRERFSQHGDLEKVVLHKHYAFVFFVERAAALNAIEAENGNTLIDTTLSVELAKPVSEQQRKKIKELKEKRDVQMGRGGGGFDNRCFPPARGGYPRGPYAPPPYGHYPPQPYPGYGVRGRVLPGYPRRPAPYAMPHRGGYRPPMPPAYAPPSYGMGEKRRAPHPGYSAPPAKRGRSMGSGYPAAAAGYTPRRPPPTAASYGYGYGYEANYADDLSFDSTTGYSSAYPPPQASRYAGSYGAGYGY